MKQGIQNVLENAGNYACYYLCLCQLAGSSYISNDIDYLTGAGLLKADFTVMNAGEIYSFLTGQKWAHTKEGPDYEPKPGELVIYEYFYDKSGLNHFRLADWDPLENSKTVKLGVIRSTRVLRRTV
jgi:hypothetical protein